MTNLSLALSDEALDEIAVRVAEVLGSWDAGPEPWVDVRAAAEHLSCKPQRIYDLVSRNAIPFRKDGSRLLFRCSELDAYLGSREPAGCSNRNGVS